MGPTDDNEIVGRKLRWEQAKKRARLIREWKEADTPGTESYEKIKSYFKTIAARPKRIYNGLTPMRAIEVALKEYESNPFMASDFSYYLSRRFPNMRWTSVRVGQLLKRHQVELGVRLLRIGTNGHSHGLWSR